MRPPPTRRGVWATLGGRSWARNLTPPPHTLYIPAGCTIPPRKRVSLSPRKSRAREGGGRRTVYIPLNSCFAGPNATRKGLHSGTHGRRGGPRRPPDVFGQPINTTAGHAFRSYGHAFTLSPLAWESNAAGHAFRSTLPFGCQEKRASVL